MLLRKFGNFSCSSGNAGKFGHSKAVDIQKVVRGTYAENQVHFGADRAEIIQEVFPDFPDGAELYRLVTGVGALSAQITEKADKCGAGAVYTFDGG